MNAEVQAFVDKWAEKTAAKYDSLEAVGEAKLAELKGDDKKAKAAWKVVEKRGFTQGDEGDLYGAAYDLAEAYVDGHPAEFASFEQWVSPDGGGHETLVRLIDTLREHGREEEAAKLTMFELVRFERQQIGGEVRAKVRYRDAGRS